MPRKNSFYFLLLLVAACRPLDMYDQDKVKPYKVSDFFEDKRTARQPPQGTVPQEETQVQPALSEKDLDRGQERFDIYCAPCHGYAGYGDGMIVQRGFTKPPSLHEERLRTMNVEHFFQVQTGGFGRMPAYRFQIPVRDRWLIAAYVRALQLSQKVDVKDLTPEERENL